MAPQNGKVIKTSDSIMKVRYDDGKEESFKVGSQYGTMEGTNYKHVLVTALKQGDVFEEGDALYYHKDFFERDWLNPKRIIFKTNRVFTGALAINSESFEDSSAISKEMTETFSVEIPMLRSFIWDFSTEIVDLVSVGDIVEPSSTLMINMGEGMMGGNLSDLTKTMLEAQVAVSPRAKYSGVIDRIEIRYNGEITNMSKSLAELATRLDKEMYERTKGTKHEVQSCAVSNEYSSGGTGLELGKFEIKIYILTKLPMAIGDKWVVANQAKTVIGEVFNYDMHGEKSRDKVHWMFSPLGFLHRKIESPHRMGIINRILRLASKDVAAIYFGKK